MTTTPRHDKTGGSPAGPGTGTTPTTTPAPAHRRRWAVLVICCVAAALLGIDNSVLNYAIPSLSRELGPSSTQLLWIVDVYGFVLGGLLIVAGNIGDRIGRKKLLLLGVTGFGLASALTAYASSPEMLIAARALLGLAGATIMPSTLSLVRSAFTDPRERTTAIGISSGIGAASFALGPVVGGALLDHFWWGSVFLINVPVMAVVLVTGVVILPESRNPHPGRLDWASVPMSIIGMFGVIYAIKTAARDGVDDRAVWISAAIGVAALAAFLRRQTAIDHPLLDLKLFRNPAFAGAVGSNVVTLFTATTLSLGFSLYFQVVRGWSPLTAGLALLPGPLSAAFAAPLSALLIPRIGRARTVALGLVLMGLSTAALGLVTAHSSYWMLLPALVVNGVGLIFTFSVTADTILASVPKTRTGTAAAISETAMEIGGALGIAVLGSVLTSLYRTDLTLPAGLSARDADAARESVTGGVQTGAQLGGSTGQSVIEAAQRAFTDSMHTTTAIAAALMLLGAAGALIALRNVPAVLDEHDGDPDGGPGAEGGGPGPLAGPAPETAAAR